MSKKSLIIRWIKYNHDILNGVLPGSEETNSFRKLLSELSARNISSLMIAGFCHDSYVVEYLEGQTKKTMRIFISEIEMMKMKGIENPCP